MKKILFIIGNLHFGGAEKSLINLLHELEAYKDLFEISLLLFDSFDEKFQNNLLPSYIKQIYLSSDKIPFLFFHKIVFKILYLLGNLFKSRNQLQYFYLYFILKLYKQSIIKSLDSYDVSISYLEGACMYFNVDFIKSKIKIGWIHNDYPFLNMNKNIDNIYLKKNDYIITVSETCKDSLIKSFPLFRERFHVIENINSANLIIKMSTKVEDEEFINYKGLKILTIGRLVYQKGIDYAVNAAFILKKMGLEFKWYIIGNGEQFNNLNRMVFKYKLTNNFIFLGNIKNPYPYIKFCDFYVQPSRFEGKSIALEEAKILKKPIIITNFPSASDQFNSNTAIFSEINAEDLASNIYNLYNDSNLRFKLINNQVNENMNISIALTKLINLFY